jgi:hypothetical protein
MQAHALSRSASPARQELPIGFFGTGGAGPQKRVPVEGVPVAESVIHDLGGGADGTPSPRTIRRVLYAGPGEVPFAVHSVLETPRNNPPLVGVLQRYPNLAEVMHDHPDLARSASSGGTSRPVPRPGRLPRRPGDTAKGDPSDASSAFP